MSTWRGSNYKIIWRLVNMKLAAGHRGRAESQDKRTAASQTYQQDSVFVRVHSGRLNIGFTSLQLRLHCTNKWTKIKRFYLRANHVVKPGKSVRLSLTRNSERKNSIQSVARQHSRKWSFSWLTLGSHAVLKTDGFDSGFTNNSNRLLVLFEPFSGLTALSRPLPCPRQNCFLFGLLADSHPVSLNIASAA